LKALVTGATGFVGRALCAQLALDGVEVVPVVRDHGVARGMRNAVCRDLDSPEPWDEVMRDVDVVFHLAAHVHQMNGGDPETYSRVNGDATRRLAEAAARAGVKRFVFLSSAKVNGESTESTAFRETDPPHPEDSYGRSKLAGEQALQALAQAGLSFVIIRSPLVYGPGVKANFLSLLRLADRGLPLPLAGIQNRRSLIFVGNLVNVLTTAASDPRAVSQTFFVSDGDDLSTPDLIARVGAALGKRARLFPVPSAFLRLAASMLGKKAQLERLVGSLSVDTSAIRSKLGWRPPFTVEQGLRETVAWYREQR